MSGPWQERYIRPAARSRSTPAHGLAPTHVIAVTANILEHHFEAARLAGMDAFQSKPLRKNDLVAHMAQLRKTRAPRSEAPDPVNGAEHAAE